MAQQTCPRCGNRFETSRNWGSAALSLLMPAPAVRDMATQVRCPHCQHVFADSDVRYKTASGKALRRIALWSGVALVLWAVATWLGLA
jgi:uncharacterized C2H2 Zn-finger protein